MENQNPVSADEKSKQPTMKIRAIKEEAKAWVQENKGTVHKIFAIPVTLAVISALVNELERLHTISTHSLFGNLWGLLTFLFLFAIFLLDNGGALVLWKNEQKKGAEFTFGGAWRALRENSIIGKIILYNILEVLLLTVMMLPAYFGFLIFIIARFTSGASLGIIVTSIFLGIISLILVVYFMTGWLQWIYIVFERTEEEEKVQFWETFDKSSKLMKGHRLHLIGFRIRFFWWFLLGLVSFSISYYWFSPYLQMAQIKYFKHLREFSKVNE